MLRSENVEEITKALVAAQKSFSPIVKSKIAKGTKFNFAYADLADVIGEVIGPLNENNIVLIQNVVSINADDTLAIETILMHTSGQFIGSILPLIYDGRDMQSLGSAITYGKRYGLSALLGIATEDDDGAAAKQRRPQPVRYREPDETEAKVIEKVWGGLVDSAPDGKVVSMDKIKSHLYHLKKGNYPRDEQVVGAIVDYFLKENRIEAVCVDSKEYRQ